MNTMAVQKQMHLRQKKCLYAHKHKAQDPPFKNNQYKNLYYQTKCRLYFCASCLKQLLIAKQKLQRYENDFFLRLPCWCKVRDKQIYQFLAMKCKECTKLITAVSTAVSFSDGYYHAKCYRLIEYRNKISIDAASIRNKATSLRSVSFLTHAIEVQSPSLLGKLQIIINRSPVSFQSVNERQQQRLEINQNPNIQHADQEFYPVQPWKSSIKIENYLYIECYKCKYPLPRDKLYQIHIIQQVQLADDHLYCIRCMLDASGKFITISQIKQASIQPLKAKKQQTFKKPIQSNPNPKPTNRIKPQQYKFSTERPLARSQAAPIHSLLRHRQKMNLIGDKSHLEFNRKQMLKKLSPFNVDLT